MFPSYPRYPRHLFIVAWRSSALQTGQVTAEPVFLLVQVSLTPGAHLQQIPGQRWRGWISHPKFSGHIDHISSRMLLDSSPSPSLSPCHLARKRPCLSRRASLVVWPFWGARSRAPMPPSSIPQTIARAILSILIICDPLLTGCKDHFRSEVDQVSPRGPRTWLNSGSSILHADPINYQPGKVDCRLVELLIPAIWDSRKVSVFVVNMEPVPHPGANMPVPQAHG